MVCARAVPAMGRILLATIAFACCGTAAAQTVWSDLTLEISKPALGNPADFADVISPSVALTRGDIEGMFNLAQESAYVRHTSPEGTRWASDWNNPGATISAANWAALDFDTWFIAYGSAVGFAIVDTPAVLHLLAEDVYLDIEFTSWGVGNAEGGSFSYLRAEGELPSAGPTGDYNIDGVVDTADYTAWRDTLGQGVDPPGAGADGDESGVIDEGDFLFWKQQFGTVVAESAAVTAVPEPTTITVALISIAAALGRLRRGRTSAT